MLYLIGLGLNDKKDITLRGLEAIRRCERLYLENYSSALINTTVENLENFYGKKIIVAERELVEQSEEIVAAAAKKNVALLVIGDPLTATTHLDIMMRAKEKNVDVRVVHNASVLTAVGITGLQLYKFGKTVTIPYPEVNFKPEIFYEVLKQNKILGLHTLLLLDLRPSEGRFMTVAEAIGILTKIEGRRNEKVFDDNTRCLGCARLGSDNQRIWFGSSQKLRTAEFGRPPFCLIVPGELHYMEEEAIKEWELSDEKTA